MKRKKWFSILSWHTIIAGILAGGIIHILATLAIPYTASTTAYKQLAPSLPVNKLVVTPVASAKSQTLPFMTPEVRVALCRYNISRGPVRISARLLDPSWTLALYTPQGDNFHTTTGLSSQRNDVTFDLISPAPKFLGIFQTSTRPAQDRVTVTVPQKTGLMVLRAPINGTAFTQEVTDAMKLASCRRLEP